jgi:ubiquinone biosynthesis protein UbiJ
MDEIQELRDRVKALEERLADLTVQLLSKPKKKDKER